MHAPQLTPHSNDLSLAASGRRLYILDVKHARLPHAGGPAIKWKLGRGTIRDMDRTKRSLLADCSPCIQGRMRNKLMKMRNHVEKGPGAVVHTDMTVMNDLPLGRARHLVSFISEAFGYVSSVHIEPKGEAAEILKRQV